MNSTQLEQKLLAAGCHPNNFSIGAPWQKTDLFCLEQVNGVWQVYYSERGQRSAPIFETTDETAACAFYFDHIMQIQHRHLVGFFESEARAVELMQRLAKAGLTAVRNDMPPLKAGTPPIKRVFVIGTEIFPVRQLYPTLPLTDLEPNKRF